MDLKLDAAPCLVIPVETKARELYSKLYLGCVAAERGFKVVIGGARALRERICWLPKGAFFLDKSVAPSRVEWFTGYRKLGLRMVAWCEEGLVFCDEQEYLRRKVDPAALGMVEAFFVWGPHQENVILRHAPESADKIVRSGNPRIDVMSAGVRGVFANDAETLRAKYPGLILINTNFCHCNHKKGEGAFLEELKKNGKIRTPSDEAFIVGQIAFKRRLFDSFMVLIPMLCQAFPECSLVIRPHPSENHGAWARLADQYPNLHVVYEGAVTPWLLAASLVVHNGCTTGLEATLLGRPVVAYKPYESARYDNELPNRVSARASSPEEVITEIRKALKSGGRDLTAADRSVIQSHLYHHAGGAAECIVEHLWRNYPCRPQEPVVWRATRPVRRTYWQIRLKPRLARPPDPHVMQKFPGLSLEEVNALLRLFQDRVGRFSSLRANEIMDGQSYLVATRGSRDCPAERTC